MARKKKEVPSVDLGEMNEIKENNSAPEAKVLLQAYAKERGIKVSKSNISVDNMIAKILEIADERENGKIGAVPSVEKPKSDTNVSILEDEEVEAPKFIADDGSHLIEEESVVEKPIKNKFDDVESVLEVEEAPVSVSKVEEVQPIEKPTEITQKAIDVDSGDSFVLEKGFEPTVKLIGRTGNQYMNIPYWILDWIESVGYANWKTQIHKYPRESEIKILKSMLYYIETKGSITIRESRNSRFHHIY